MNNPTTITAFRINHNIYYSYIKFLYNISSVHQPLITFDFIIESNT